MPGPGHAQALVVEDQRRLHSGQQADGIARIHTAFGGADLGDQQFAQAGQAQVHDGRIAELFHQFHRGRNAGAGGAQVQVLGPQAGAFGPREVRRVHQRLPQRAVRRAGAFGRARHQVDARRAQKARDELIAPAGCTGPAAHRPVRCGPG
jgi:hypothetical protein